MYLIYIWCNVLDEVTLSPSALTDHKLAMNCGFKKALDSSQKNNTIKDWAPEITRVWAFCINSFSQTLSKPPSLDPPPHYTLAVYWWCLIPGLE